ncbi:MAG: VOC family protein [Rubricoccaceae bacterium]|nr:VOC family protein [Rubricoccaceae bacterium]
MQIERYAEGHFCWADLATPDPEAAHAFYGDLFGWSTQPLDDDHPPYLALALDGRRVAGLRTRPPHTPAAWTAYANVRDLDRTLARATRRGAHVLDPPATIGSAARRAILADPEGAAVGLWQADRLPGFEHVNAPGACIWNELNARDPLGAQRFYAALFDWRFHKVPDNPAEYWAIRIPDGYNADGYNGGILQMTDEWGDMPAHWITAFAVDDILAAAHRIRLAGGAVLAGPANAADGPFAVAADPHGAVFMVIQPPA